MKKIAITIVFFCTLYSAYSLDYRQVIFGNSYKNIIEIDADAFFEQYPAVKEFTAGSKPRETTYARVYEQIIGENTFYRVVLSYEKLTEADFLDWKNLYFRQFLFLKKSNTNLLELGVDSIFGDIDYNDNPMYEGIEIIERNNKVIGIMKYTLSESDSYNNEAWYNSWQNILNAEEEWWEERPTISYTPLNNYDIETISITASNPLVDSRRPFMYTIQNAFDGNPATSYVENTEDDMFYFRIEHYGDYNRVPVPKCTSYMIINGYASGDYYYQNNQIAKIAVGSDSSNGTTYYTSYGSFQLNDTVKPQVMNFEVMKNVVFRMDVQEITKGTLYNDTAIAEFDIYFEGEGWVFGSSDNDTVLASPAIVYEYEYTIKDDGSAEIKRYNGEAAELTISSIIEYEEKTYTLTSIGNSAFKDCTNLTSITIPDSVTSIGDSAFRDCTNLTSVTIPDSVTSIEGSAFAGCSSLTSITIPDSVTSIGDSIFARSGLKSITIPDSVTSIGDSIFARSGLTSITIPDSVTSIEDSAFYSTNLTSITIPNSVTSIGDWAFSECYNLTSITIPDGVTAIGNGAFSNCRSLTSITIPDSVTSIGNVAFAICENLTSVTIPDSVTSIGNAVFSKCENLTSVTIPNSVTSIGDQAFSDCNKLTSITIPNSVTSIGDGAFSYSGLTSITIPSSVTSIGDRAFAWCDNLTSVTIPSSVTSIGEKVFDDCDNLAVSVFPNSYALEYAKENNIPYIFVKEE